MPHYNLIDAQQAMGFMVNQASYIETEIYRVQYPEIQYPFLIPVDESAPEWVKSITFFSMDHVGQAEWFHHAATDMRLADITRNRFEVGVEMAGIGYRYTLEEIGQSVMLGMNLPTERAAAAVRAYEEFVERVAIAGDTDKGWTGLINDTNVAASTVPVGAGGGATTAWATKTGDEIVKDVNALLTGIYTQSNSVEMANTLLLPIDQFNLIATKRLSDTTEQSVLDWLNKYNVYTAQTGAALTIRAVRQLDNAAGGGTQDRMVAYKRDPSVLKMHIPMRHRFLPVWQTGPITFDVPGIFRLGGVEIRRPVSVRYADGI
jgi:hypothetical protein